MQVYISNLDNISKDIDNINSMIAKLSSDELKRFELLSRPLRKMQFLAGHCMLHDIIGKYTSISHKDNIVIVAVSDGPVGIDIENTDVVRDFIGISVIINLPAPKSKLDFYMNFVRYESEFKIGRTKGPICTNYYEFGKYIIGVSGTEQIDNIDFIDYLTSARLSLSPVFRNSKNDIK